MLACVWFPFRKYFLEQITVKLGDKEQIGVKEPFSLTNLPVDFNFRVAKKFRITKFGCIYKKDCNFEPFCFLIKSVLLKIE